MRNGLYLYSITQIDWTHPCEDIETKTGLICATNDTEAMSLIKGLYPEAFEVTLTSFNSYRIHLSEDSYDTLRSKIIFEQNYYI